jgi:hypothetical protein
MTQDARNSLIAVASVTAIVAASSLFLWLFKDAELPSWTPYAVLGLNLLIMLIGIFRWRRDRSRRRKASIAGR